MAETTTLGFGVTFDMAAIRMVRGQTLTLTSHRGHDEHPPHRHSNDYICIVLSGGFGELQRDEWVERRNGAVFVHEAGQTHHDRIGPAGAICLNLHLVPGEPRPSALAGTCPTAARIAADELALALTGTANDELLVGALAAEIMARVTAGAASAQDRGDWLRTVVEAIADEPTRRWSLDELARIAGRHPVHLAQAFRARTGISLGAYQRRRRLLRLGLALRRGLSPLAALAHEFGYCDQSHMSGEFRAAYGISPGRYRREFH